MGYSKKTTSTRSHPWFMRKGVKLNKLTPKQAERLRTGK